MEIYIDEELAFKNHINKKMNKSNKDTVVIRKLRNFRPCLALLIIYRSFVRSHLVSGDAIYDQPGNGPFYYRAIPSLSL